MIPDIAAGTLTWCDVCAIVAYLTYLYLTRGTTLRHDATARITREQHDSDVAARRAANGSAPEAITVSSL